MLPSYLRTTANKAIIRWNCQRINIFIMCSYNSLCFKRDFILSITKGIVPGPYLDGSIANKKIVWFQNNNFGVTSGKQRLHTNWRANLLPLTKKFFVFFEKATEPTAPRWPLPMPIQFFLSASHNLTCVQKITLKNRKSSTRMHSTAVRIIKRNHKQKR